MNVIKSLKHGSAVAGLALLSSPVFAAVDTTAAVAEIDSAKTAVLTIGAAVFAVVVGIKLYKWIKRAL